MHFATNLAVLKYIFVTHLEVLERFALDAPVADIAVALLLQQGPPGGVPRCRGVG